MTKRRKSNLEFSSIPVAKRSTFAANGFPDSILVRPLTISRHLDQLATCR